MDVHWIGVFIYSLLSDRMPVDVGAAFAGMSALAIVMVYLRMKKLQMSDNEIAGKMRSNEQQMVAENEYCCSACGADIAYGQAVCPSCGERLEYP